MALDEPSSNSEQLARIRRRPLHLILNFVFIIATSDAAATVSQWYDNYDFSGEAVLAYWPFDDDARDVTGNGFDGIPLNVTSVASQFGQAYVLVELAAS